jgi:uncharacterized phage protein gp47/JayE|nr:MAG TPA: Baseplate J like protein [Caudoviricetes sp.]
MYFKPYIDETGYHYPAYEDIKQHHVDAAKKIFGDDIYLEEDSMDYQFLAILSESEYDTYQSVEHAIICRSPSTAVGTGLDSVVKLNGIKRKDEKYSTVNAILNGTKGTLVKNGKVIDKSNIIWNLPSEVKFDDEEITIKITCSIPGPIVCNPGDIVTIATTQYGWNSVRIEESATLGRLIESPEKLRIRQTKSVSLPSKSILDGTYAALSNLEGTDRVEIYENFTDRTNGLGIPSHSIACVVENGDDEEIAKSILIHKGPGCGTYGTTSAIVQDSRGKDNTINYFRPTFRDIDVNISIKKLNKFTTADTDNIKKNTEEYLNSLNIGTDIDISMLWAISVKSIDLTNPTFSVLGITICIHGGTLSSNNIDIAFNECARGNKDYITISEV